MKITFKPLMMKTWTLDGDYIIIGGKSVYLGTAKMVEHTHAPKNRMQNGVIQLFVEDVPCFLCYPYKQCEEGLKAAQYIQKRVFELKRGNINQ